MWRLLEWGNIMWHAETQKTDYPCLSMLEVFPDRVICELGLQRQYYFPLWYGHSGQKVEEMQSHMGFM